MNFTDYLSLKNIIFDLTEMNIENLIDTFLQQCLNNEPIFKNCDLKSLAYNIKQRILEREKLGTTAVGQGVAFLFAYNRPELITLGDESIVGIGISKPGIRWYSETLPELTSLDGELVYIIVFELSNKSTNHLKILAKISKFLKNKIVRSDILNATTPEQVIEIIRFQENELLIEKDKKQL